MKNKILHKVIEQHNSSYMLHLKTQKKKKMKLKTIALVYPSLISPFFQKEKKNLHNYVKVVLDASILI